MDVLALVQLCLKMIDINAIKQLIRYGVAGLTLNLIGYTVYLMLTWIGFEPKLVITVTYPTRSK